MAVRPPAAAAGFTVKSGWACAVLVSGGPATPTLLDVRRIELSDPAVPEARQPYHDGFGTARAPGQALNRLVRSVERFGRGAVADLLREYSGAHAVRGVGIVVGSLVDPATLGNSHVRIHALEGQLFRGVVCDAAAAAGLRCAVWRAKDLPALAAPRLQPATGTMQTTVLALGRGRGPWRSEHKLAALAAWLVLAGGAGRPAPS